MKIYKISGADFFKIVKQGSGHFGGGVVEIIFKNEINSKILGINSVKIWSKMK